MPQEPIELQFAPSAASLHSQTWCLPSSHPWTGDTASSSGVPPEKSLFLREWYTNWYGGCVVDGTRNTYVLNNIDLEGNYIITLESRN